jgi:acetoin:2,6-dichlorophenolindophenol oxidoreductase subunit beta
MYSAPRELSFSLAINEAIHQAMAADASVMLLGQGVKSPWYVGNTARGLLDTFGPNRVIDTPVSENAVTGAAVGAALAGMRPIVVHPRMDFMLYAMDPIINEAANWHYMSGGRISVPVVFWGIVNRGGEQGAQHSQGIFSMFCHVPGLKVVAPSRAVDAKGLMMAAIRDDNPILFVDDRSLYPRTEVVDVDPYETPIGKAHVRRTGRDATLYAYSAGVSAALEAAERLQTDGIDVMVVDLRTLKPLDVETIRSAAALTGRVVVLDTCWKSFGVGSEILAVLAENAVPLIAPPVRLALPDVPAPAARSLEAGYFVTQQQIIDAVRSVAAVERPVYEGLVGR